MYNFSDIHQKQGTASNAETNGKSLPTPKQIVSYLDQYVQGQDRAKRAVALALYTHLIYLLCRDNRGKLEDMGISENFSFASQPLLLMGPTGSGKSYLLKRATEFVSLPCSFVSATSLVQTGYVGLSIDKMMESHYMRCQKNLKRAENAIIYIDEIDKIRAHSDSGGPDVSGEGVQNALLTLFDGRPVTVSENGHSDNAKKIDIDTSGVLFICTGAFAAGLSEIIRTRLNDGSKTRIGFNHSGDDSNSNRLDDAEILSRVETEDLIKYGFIPEFIGRFATIATLDALTTEDLVNVLVRTKDSAVQKHKQLFAFHGIDLVFTQEALMALAKRALELKTGARALNRIVNDCLLDFEYQLPELSETGVCRITINENTVFEGKKPAFKYAGKSKNAKLSALQNLPKQFADLTTKLTLLPGGKQFSNPNTMTSQQLRERIEALKKEKLDWDNTIGSAHKWWEAFENENQHRLGLVLRLAEELTFMEPPATITEFFLAYVYSNTDNIQANLYYLHYTRLKKAEQRRKEEANRPHSVILMKVPADRKIAVLKVTRQITGFGLKEAKDLIESAPVTLCQSVSQERASELKHQLEDAGAQVDVKVD